MKKYLNPILSVIFLISFAAAKIPANSASKSKDKKNVLILHSYHQGLEWTETIEKGIRDQLDSRDDINIFIEHMDSKRHMQPQILSKLKEIYSTKYKNTKMALLICSDDNAFQFLIKNRTELFPGAPIIFCGVGNYTHDLRAKYGQITGVIEELNMDKTLDLIQSLHNGINTIIVIGDQTPSSKNDVRLLKAILKKNQYPFLFEFITDNTIESIQKKLNRAPANSVALLLHYNKDRNGKFLAFKEVARKLSKTSSIPIYSYWDFYINNGVTGGYVIGGYAQGEKAGKLANQFLDGTPISKIPVITKSPNFYLFDYNRLKRFKINSRFLPDSSVIINKPVPLIIRYEKATKVIISLLLTLLAFILVLWLYLSRKSLKQLTAQDKKFQHELDLASNIQKGILPQMPYKKNGINIVAHYKAMHKIGGDYFDIFPMENGYTGILIADVSGHGIPAALVTSLAKAGFDEATRSKRFPSEIFSYVNNKLHCILKNSEYLTAFFVVISPSYELYYSNASHQKGIIVRKQSKQIESLDSNGLFLGALSEAQDFYEDKIDYLHFGDRLFLFTDGLVESRNSRDQEFGEVRLHELLMETSNLPLDRARDEIILKWKEFTANTEVNDDVCFIIIEIDPEYERFITHKNKAIEYYYQNELELAEKELKFATDIDTLNSGTIFMYAKILSQNFKYDEAIGLLLKYLSSSNEDATAWYNLAVCYYNSGNYPKAAEASKRANYLKPNFSSALYIQNKCTKKEKID